MNAEWISTNDKHPESGYEVLFVRDSKIRSSNKEWVHRDVYYGVYYGNNGDHDVWCAYGNGYVTSIPDWEVSYWMLKPEPSEVS